MSCGRGTERPARSSGRKPEGTVATESPVLLSGRSRGPQADPSVPEPHLALAEAHGHATNARIAPGRDRSEPEVQALGAQPLEAACATGEAEGGPPGPSRRLALHPSLRRRLDRPGRALLRRPADGHLVPANVRTPSYCGARAPRTTGRRSSRCGSPSVPIAADAATTRGPTRRGTADLSSLVIRGTWLKTYPPLEGGPSAQEEGARQAPRVSIRDEDRRACSPTEPR